MQIKRTCRFYIMQLAAALRENSAMTNVTPRACAFTGIVFFFFFFHGKYKYLICIRRVRALYINNVIHPVI